MLRRRDWNATLAVVAGLIVAAVLVNHTYCEPARENAPAICLGGDAWFDIEQQKLAEWYERNGDPETALAYLRRAAAGESLRGPGQLYLWIGRLELSQAQRARAAGDGARAAARLAAAVPALRAVVEQGYHVHEAQTYLADVYQLQGDAERALAASDAALRARPADPIVLLSALRMRVALGRCDDALRLRDEIKRFRPNDAEIDRVAAPCAVSRAG